MSRSKPAKTKLSPRLGAEFAALTQRKAGPHAHKLSKRQKTRNKAKKIRDRIEEESEE